MKKPLILKIALPLLLVAVFLAIGAFMVKKNARGPSGTALGTGEGTTSGGGIAEAVNVVVLPLVPESIEETFVLPGTLEAWQNLTLSLEQSGPIVWVGPTEGSRVKAGQPILMIDKSLLETQHTRNQTAFELARKQLERVMKLFEKQLVSQRELDEARKAFDNASADLEQSSIGIEKSTLMSPIDGILEEILVERGEYGNAGMPAAVVVQVDRLKVVVDVPEKDVDFVRPGQEVEVLTADLETQPGVVKMGRVFHLSYLADQLTRTYQAKVGIDNPGGLLRPGKIVRARFVRRTLDEVILVPLYAVLERGGKRSVYVEADGRAFVREIEVGPIIGDRVVVSSGLEKGENLIVRGQQLVADGDPVNVREDHRVER